MPEGNPYDPDWTEQEGESDPFDAEPSDEDLDSIERENDEFNENMDNILAHYQQEEQEFNEAEQEFTEKYGFVHKCRCSEDWAEGNLGVVSVCYMNMVADAMDTLETTRQELKDVKRELARLRIAG